MRNKNKKVYFVLILIVLFGISVGYAAISRTLSITGNSVVEKNTWDIHFENIQIKNGSVTATKEPTLENSNTTVNFSFMLDLPGDYYEFTVDAVNRGTIDAMIESITKTPELTTEQAKYLNYEIEYENGEQITSKQLIKKNSFVRIKVHVEYIKDITIVDLPTVNQNLNLGFTVNCVQGDSFGISVENNGVLEISADGSLDEIGTIVTIGTEKFYTIGIEGDNVKLLSMYNLYVGGEYNVDTKIWTAYGEEATGKQDENMLGFKPRISLRKGTTGFSSDEQKGENYSSYTGSIVEKYVNNYKTLLENNYGIVVLEARLITYSELTNTETFACEEYDYCSKKYPWIYLTSYWTGSAQNATGVWRIDTHGRFDCNDYKSDYYLGVRPVIIVAKSLF